MEAKKLGINNVLVVCDLENMIGKDDTQEWWDTG